MTLYAIDVETSGLDPFTSSILSIGAVDIQNPKRTFYAECRPFPGAEVHEGALNVNGFTEDYLAALPNDEASVIKEFFVWLSYPPMLLAHNAKFDHSFLQAAADRASLPNPFGFRSVDIHSIVHAHMVSHQHPVPKKLSLNECLAYAGLPPEPNPHNALTGAQCNYEIYQFITKKS